MALSDLESRILGELTLHGDASLRELTQALGAPLHKVRYAVERLFERKLATRRVVVNSYRLGYHVCGLWFSLSAGVRKQRSAILRYLCASNTVGYLGEFGGEFTFKADLYVRSAADTETFLADLHGRFGALFSARSFSSTLSISDFPLKYLTPHISGEKTFRVGFDGEPVNVSNSDLELLRLLGAVGDQSLSSLAKRLKIPLSTMEFRIKKLRDSRIIVGYQLWAQAEPMKMLGHQLLVHRVRLNCPSGENAARLLKFCQGDPAIFSLTRSIGDFDAELCSLARSPREEREFLRRLEAEVGDLFSTHTTAPVVEHHKITNVPF